MAITGSLTIQDSVKTQIEDADTTLANTIDDADILNDGTLTAEELKGVVLDTYWGKYKNTNQAIQHANRAVDYFFQKANEGTAASILASREFHLAAGGLILEHGIEVPQKVETTDQNIIVTDNVSGNRGVVKQLPYIRAILQNPGITCDQFLRYHDDYKPDEKLDRLELSYKFALPRSPNQPYLATFIQAAGNWTAATQILEKTALSNGHCRVTAHKVKDEVAKTVYQTTEALAAYDAALSRRKKDPDATREFLRDAVIGNMHAVQSSVQHEYDPNSGILIYTNRTYTTAIMNLQGPALGAAVLTALLEVNDPRQKGGFAIPTWDIEIDSDGKASAPDKSESYKPGVK